MDMGLHHPTLGDIGIIRNLGNCIHKLNEHVKRISIINITSQKKSDIKDQVNELYDELCMCMHEAVRDLNRDEKTHRISSKTKKTFLFMEICRSSSYEIYKTTKKT